MTEENGIDILQIDNLIRTNLTNKRDSPSEILLGQREIEDILNNGEISMEFKSKIDNWYRDKNKNIQNDTKNFYLLDTIELIQEYKQTLKIPIKINFLEDQKKLNGEYSETKNQQKTSLINEYMDKVKNYDILEARQISLCPKNNINTNGNNLPQQICSNENCKSSEITESIEYLGIYICLECGHQETTMNLANSIRLNHNDSKRINICSKYSYDKKTHFLNCINQYQGKHKIGIEPEIIQLLEVELDKYKLIDHTKKTRRAKYKNVTKEHIFLFVKELKLIKCYGDINLIHHIITDYPLNDISHLTEKLLQDFDQFVQMHHKIYSHDTDKKNFNYQHLLYQLLLRHKYPCNSTEFNFLKTIDRKYYHDEICRVIFENLGWNYSSLF